MFFVPIAAVVLFIWYLVHLFMAYNEGVYIRDRKRSTALTEALTAVAEDRDLERSLNRSMTQDKALQIMRSYLPKTPEWDFYIDHADAMECAVLIRMAEQGKIPYFLLWSLGTYFRVAYYDIPKADYARSLVLNEQFLLMIESELNMHGVDAVLLFQRQTPQTGPWTPLRRYMEKFGPGFSDNTFKYRFTASG